MVATHVGKLGCDVTQLEVNEHIHEPGLWLIWKIRGERRGHVHQGRIWVFLRGRGMKWNIGVECCKVDVFSWVVLLCVCVCVCVLCVCACYVCVCLCVYVCVCVCL